MLPVDFALVGLLLDAALKASVLLSLALVLTRLHSRTRASLRIRLLVTALAGVVALPLLGALLPGWSLPLMPDPLNRGARLHAKESRSVPVSTTERFPLGVGDARPLELENAWRLESLAPAQTHETTTVASLRPPTPAGWSPSGAFVIALLWGTGVAWSLLRQRAAHRRVRELEREARVEVDDRSLAALERAARRVGVERPVQLLASHAVATPMTWGHRYPVVVLPADHQEWSDERHTIVLHHELVHVLRGDWLIRVLARAACALYWFHPLAWATLSRLVEEQEHACDEQVLALGTRASCYAHHLLALARREATAQGPTIPLPALPMARRPQLEVRLMSILNASRERSSGRKAALALPALILLSGLVPVLATMVPWAYGPLSPVSLTEPAETTAPQPPQSPQTPPTAEASPANAPTAPATREEALEELATAAREIERLEARLEPHERRLEAVEAELEPVEAQLEDFSVSLEPFEGRLDDIEAELEPLELELAEIEARLEPHEGQLEEVAVGLEPFEGRLEAIESELTPYEAELAELEARLEPFETRLQETEALYRVQTQELEARARELEARHEAEQERSQREELERVLEDLHRQLEPFHRQMEEIHSEMQPVLEQMKRIQAEMAPVHERMREVQREMEPTFERMRQVHAEMEPVFEEMRAVQERMEPMHERMRDVQREMEPVLERMREVQVDMEPVQERMREVHREMESVHAEMSALHERIERAAEVFIRSTLGEELGALSLDEGTLARLEGVVRDSVHLNLDENHLTFRGSESRLRDRIAEVLRESGRTGADVDEASARAARALLELDIEVE